MELGYEVHVGGAEQRKDKQLREISIPMVSNVEFGIPLSAFDSIKEIDLLVVKDHVILAAFEIATTIATANKAINDRYRNLFTVFPTWTVKAIKSQDYAVARAQLLSPANEREHLSQKVRILKVSQLTRNAVNAVLQELGDIKVTSVNRQRKWHNRPLCVVDNKKGWISIHRYLAFVNPDSHSIGFSSFLS